ncbi:MAG: ABC transporter ATP-binding protein, partial [Sphingobacteriaceae bacterium]
FLKVQQGEIQSTHISIDEIRGKYALADDEKCSRQKKYQQEPLLKIKNLNTWFPVKSGFFQPEKEPVKAVHNISFEVFPGETLGLVGESGCGKTTLGRSIIRLIEPTSGKISFKNQDILTLPPNEMRRMRKKMQLIFQDPYSSLNPKQSVGEAIFEPMTVHQLFTNPQQRKKKVLQLLDRVGLLPEHFNRYPHEFSGGQRQRIVIARALALQPEFLICDESVSALDVSVQAQVLNLLKDLQQEFNLTYLFISHDLAVVKHLSDRVMVMNKGEIIEIGDPETIYHHPKQAYTQKLIASIPKQ